MSPPWSIPLVSCIQCKRMMDGTKESILKDAGCNTNLILKGSVVKHRTTWKNRLIETECMVAHSKKGSTEQSVECLQETTVYVQGHQYRSD